MLEKIKNWYEEHDEEICAGGIYVGATCFIYLITTGFMVWWKKLGLYDNK